MEPLEVAIQNYIGMKMNNLGRYIPNFKNILGQVRLEYGIKDIVREKIEVKMSHHELYFEKV